MLDERPEKKDKVVKEPKENLLLTEINKLSAKVEELTSVRDEVRDLKKQMFESHNSKPQNFDKLDSDTRQSYRRRRRIFKCKNCEAGNRDFCDHCFLCGST